MKKLIGLTAIALAITVNVPSFAHGHMKHFGAKIEKAADKLNLSDEQKNKIKAIQKNTHDALKPIWEELRPVRAKINDSFKTGPMDEGQIDNFVNQEKDIMGRMLKIRMNERNEINKVLTEQQRVQVYNMMKEWHEKHQKEMDEKAKSE